MKIAYILPSLANQGPIIVANTLIKNLIGKVDLIDVYYFDDKIGLDFPCETYRIKMNEIIDFDKYDIIHSHCLRPDKYLSKNKKRIKKAKILTTIHQDIYEGLKVGQNIIAAKIFTPLWYSYIKKLDSAVPISNYIWGIYKNLFPNIENAIYNGADIDYNPSGINDDIISLKINELKANGYHIIANYQRMVKDRGQDQLIELALYRKDLAFIIIGEGKDKANFINKIKELNLQDRIFIYPPRPKPYNYLAGTDIYAITSRFDAFGLALVEAALTKTPIICSDIEVYHEIFNDEEVSFFKLDDIYSMSQAVDRSLIQKEAIVPLAFNKAVKNFSASSLAENYLELYKKKLI